MTAGLAADGAPKRNLLEPVIEASDRTSDIIRRDGSHWATIVEALLPQQNAQVWQQKTSTSKIEMQS